MKTITEILINAVFFIIAFFAIATMGLAFVRFVAWAWGM